MNRKKVIITILSILLLVLIGFIWRESIKGKKEKSTETAKTNQEKNISVDNKKDNEEKAETQNTSPDTKKEVKKDALKEEESKILAEDGFKEDRDKGELVKEEVKADGTEFMTTVDKNTGEIEVKEFKSNGEVTVKEVNKEENKSVSEVIKRAEAPKAETPKDETPKAETPKAETQKAETPKGETPKLSTAAPKKDEITKKVITNAIAHQTSNPYAGQGTKTRVSQQGKDGYEKIEIMYTNGKETSRRVLEKVAPVTHVIQNYVKVQDAKYETKTQEVEDKSRPIYDIKEVKNRWFVKTELGVEYFYSAREARDRHIELLNKGYAGNWGTAEQEVIDSDVIIGYHNITKQLKVKVQDEKWEWK